MCCDSKGLVVKVNWLWLFFIYQKVYSECYWNNFSLVLTDIIIKKGDSVFLLNLAEFCMVVRHDTQSLKKYIFVAYL